MVKPEPSWIRHITIQPIWTSQKTSREEYLRHNNDTEVQPVPRVSEEREGSDAESSRQDFNEGLERIYTSECISEDK